MKLFKLITLKRKVEELLMLPFVKAGGRWAAKHPLQEEYDIFFFFPIYGLGGAEKVNADIISCVSDKKVIVFFTRKSKEGSSIHLFQRKNVKIKDISKWTDNKWRYWDNLFYRGVCAAYINRQNHKPVIFNGQCNFAYKLFPHLHSSLLKVELIHNSHRHFAMITLPFIPFIDKRIMVAECLISDHQKIYDEFGIDQKYKRRMSKITCKVDMPVDVYPKSNYGEKLNVYYAGRGGAQKRVWLVMKVIEQCLTLKLPVSFHLAGSFEDEIPIHIRPFITYHGILKAGSEMSALHRKMDVLMLSSAYEGFPLVIMEAMAHSVVPVATAVDGVPEHIRHGYNGLLITNPADETGVVRQLVEHIQYLSLNRNHLREMAHHAYDYAHENFREEVFCNSYRAIMELDKN
jgi:L-malate glycosyltransferase